MNRRTEESQWFCMNAVRQTKTSDELVLCDQMTISGFYQIVKVRDTFSFSSAAECLWSQEAESNTVSRD